MNGKKTARSLSVQELKQKMNAKETFFLLDVREEEEVAIASIDPSVHIPMGEITERFQEIGSNLPVIVFCHSGRRSAMVCDFLERQGYQTFNLRGGIDAWSKEIDATVPIY